MGVINLGALVEKLRKKLSGDGFITSTDYASSSSGGVIKTDTAYATDITSGGKLKAKEITAEAYSEANDAAFISKATLDNVLNTISGGGTIEKFYSKPSSSPVAFGDIDFGSSVDLTEYDVVICNFDSGSNHYVNTLTFCPKSVGVGGKFANVFFGNGNAAVGGVLELATAHSFSEVTGNANIGTYSDCYGIKF